MHNEFTAIIEQDGEWFVAYSPEIPGANGQGRSPEDARKNLDVEIPNSLARKICRALSVSEP